MRRLVKALPLLLAFLMAGAAASYAAEPTASRSWRISTPEEQGMDSKAIVRLLRIIKARKLNVHSLLIVRNGYLVTEAYFAPYHRDVIQNIDACTASVTSALVGIAQDQGKLSDLDQLVVDFFPERTISNMDNRKKEITLRDLLTMTSGLRWDQSASFFNRRNDLFSALSSPDCTQYVLNRPMEGQPGVRFNYNAGAVHLLSAILQRVTGDSEADYARERLFKPLGIQNYAWPSVSGGATYGAGGLALTPSDMAKFGWLYLNKGTWEGRAIVSAKWVQESTRSYIGDFGYLWWQNPFFDGFEANAYGGQYIFVVPKQNLVVVYTGGLSNTDYALPQRWMVDYILPAVKSNRSLPPNREMNGRLAAMLRDIQTQPAVSPGPLPGTAGRISGKTFVLESNVSRVSAFRLNFNQGGCSLELVRDGNPLVIPVGLDGGYQSAKVGPCYYFARGKWHGPKTFTLDLQIPSEYGEVLKVTLYFEGDDVAVNVWDGAARISISFKGKAKG